jgi:hypothetical protein
MSLASVSTIDGLYFVQDVEWVAMESVVNQILRNVETCARVSINLADMMGSGD